MKKIISSLFLLVCMTAIFSVCCAEALTADTITLDSVLEANDLLKISQDHTSMSYTETSYDADGTLNFEKKARYSFADGKILFDSNYSFAEDEVGSMDNCAFESDEVPGSIWYSDDMGDFDSWTIVPSSEYHKVLAQGWLYEGFEETEVSSTEADGNIILITRTEIVGLDSYYDTEYTLDAETGLISKIVRSYYESEEPVAEQTTEVSYDEAVEVTCPSREKLTTAEDLIDLTVIFHPGEDTEETQTFRVARNTYLGISSTSGFSSFFADEACEEAIYAPELSEDSMTLYAKDGLPYPDYYPEELQQ